MLGKIAQRCDEDSKKLMSDAKELSEIVRGDVRQKVDTFKVKYARVEEAVE